MSRIERKSFQRNFLKIDETESQTVYFRCKLQKKIWKRLASPVKLMHRPKIV